MPIITDSLQLPDRIFYELQRAKLIRVGEMPALVPLDSFLGFRSLPKDGFLISSGKIIFYETRVLQGRVLVVEYLLTEVKNVAYQADKQINLTFSFQNGSEYTVETNLSEDEAEQTKAFITERKMYISDNIPIIAVRK